MAKKMRPARRVTTEMPACPRCRRTEKLRDQAEEAVRVLKDRVSELEGDLKMQRLAVRNAQAKLESAIAEVAATRQEMSTAVSLAAEDTMAARGEAMAARQDAASARAEAMMAREDTVRSRQMGLPAE